MNNRTKHGKAYNTYKPHADKNEGKLKSRVNGEEYKLGGTNNFKKTVTLIGKGHPSHPHASTMHFSSEDMHQHFGHYEEAKKENL